MPMRHADSGNTPQMSERAQQRIAAKEAFQKAVNAGDEKAFSEAFEQLCDLAAADVRAEYDQKVKGLEETIESLEQNFDAQVLMNRGVRQLTTEERSYWQKFGEAAASANPRQALENLSVAMPRTVANHVFDDLRENHPLLSKLNFINAAYLTEFIVNENGYQEAQWGELCDETVKELSSAFAVHSTNLFKLSAILPLCKAMLDLGPEWLDNYVRSVMYEAAANGWEAGIFGGSGKNEPIGMDKVVGKDAVVTDAGYTAKEAIAITDLRPDTLGALMGKVSVSPAGTSRAVRKPLMVVNYTDYFEKIFPATTVLAADGTYRKDVLPYDIDIVPSVGAKTRGRAVFGDGSKYLALAGAPKDGMISYSDHYQFPQGKRMYLILTYGNGRPLDNNAFQVLDISGLKPAILRVELVEEPAVAAAGDDTAV